MLLELRFESWKQKYVKKKAEKLVQIGVNCVKRKEITKLELLI